MVGRGLFCRTAPAAGFLLLLALPAFAQETASGPTDVVELESWLDGAMEAHLEAYNSAGSVVSVVKDGKLFFSKGYGYADIEARKRVDPAKTLFRIGSVSNLFIWTAIMQLAEDGKLNLNKDVNTYLTAKEISGLSWQQYIQQNILDPLDMKQITFDQPLPEALADDLSKGYRFQDNAFVEQSFEYLSFGPVGCASASADEMAKFMIAHLQLGRYGDSTILEEDTATRMQSELHHMAPKANPMAHGFVDFTQNGQRVIGHGGDTLWFHTMLAILPERNVGIFVSHNTDSGSQAARALLEQFIDHYYPEEAPSEITPPLLFESRAEKFAGSYRPNRHSYHTLAKLRAAISTVRVVSSGDGALLRSDTGRKRWIEIEPLIFREEFGDARIVFTENDEGVITHFLVSNNPAIAYEKDGPFGRPALHLTILIASTVLFLLTIVLWPATAILRWRHNVLIPSQEKFPFAARLVAWTSSLIFLVFLVGLGVVMQDPNDIVFGVSQRTGMLLYLPIAAAVLVLAAVFYTYYVWRNGEGRILSRIFYTLLT
ncbi:MAG: serine hydrolase domain-containing protein, partial [Candidatus Hydrogenedentes bacterium]|nr:serine hydrolase domain-containing protein [Candidatus Hydrogenedentota bacterium]